MDPDLLAVRERLRTDTVFWAEHCATIVTAERRKAKLKARPWQRQFDAALERQRAAGLPMRAIILKARKLGFSTWVQGRFMQRVSQLPYQAAMTVAHRQDAANTLFKMAETIWENLPTDAQLAELLFGEGTMEPVPFSVRPAWLNGSRTKDGGGWMALGDRMRRSEASLYETLTAGSRGGGRAATPNMIHASEVAWWEDPAFLTGLFNAMPLLPDTIGIQESTANGFNHFHDAWQKAMAGEEDETGLWTPLFFGWTQNPWNSQPFISDQARDRFERTIGDEAGGGDDDEPWLVENFGVSLEQLHWRRTVRDGPECQYGSVEMFHQEHPATPEQAFIGSGQPVFPGILVARAIKAAEAAQRPVEGLLRGVEWRERRTRAGSVLVPQRAIWVPPDAVTGEDRDRWGYGAGLRVWEHPVNAATEEGKPQGERRPDGQYVVFADVAIGGDATDEAGDYHAIQVLDHVSLMQVAVYRSRIPVHDLPLLVLLAGLYFNEAWIAVEVNGPGVAVVDALRKDYRYRYMYRRHRAGDDQRTDVREQLIGWQTDRRTKPLMEQTFGLALKEGTHGLRDVQTGREATTYVKDPKDPAKHGAQKGAHDDLLMAFMGAHRVAAELRPRAPGKPKRPRPVIGDELTGY